MGLHGDRGERPAASAGGCPVGAVGGVLVQRGGRWVVDNDSEVQLLEALRGESGARDRLWALAATLDAGVVDAGHLRRLNGRLSAIVAVERPEDLWRVLGAGEPVGGGGVCVRVREQRTVVALVGIRAGGAFGREPGAGAVAGPRLGVVECAAPAALCGHGTATNIGSPSCRRRSGRGWRRTKI